MEIIIGAFLATALLFIGRCWGRQEHPRQEHYHIDMDGQVKAPIFGQDAFNHMKHNGRATVFRPGRQA
jgi:hypothetical protein